MGKDSELDLRALDEWLDKFDDDDVDVDPWDIGVGEAIERGDRAAPRQLSGGLGDIKRRQIHRRSDSLRGRERPADLPDLVSPSGYFRDRRGTWRYSHDGSAVPGARDINLDSLWPFGRKQPIDVPMELAAAATELRWCAEVGWPGEAVDRRGTATRVWSLDDDDWSWRAPWPLGMQAPELMADRLVSLEQLAKLAGGVSPGTLSGYLSRGRLVEPQVRISGRPGWALPVAMAWLRQRK